MIHLQGRQNKARTVLEVKPSYMVAEQETRAKRAVTLSRVSGSEERIVITVGLCLVALGLYLLAEHLEAVVARVVDLA